MLFVVLSLFVTSISLAQESARIDTSVVKFVRALSFAITDRMNDAGNYRIMDKSNALMFLNDKLISIDSLYKLKFADIKEIKISYDQKKYVIYGARVYYGAIVIYENEKKRKIK